MEPVVAPAEAATQQPQQPVIVNVQLANQWKDFKFKDQPFFLKVFYVIFFGMFIIVPTLMICGIIFMVYKFIQYEMSDHRSLFSQHGSSSWQSLISDARFKDNDDNDQLRK